MCCLRLTKHSSWKFSWVENIPCKSHESEKLDFLQAEAEGHSEQNGLEDSGSGIGLILTS